MLALRILNKKLLSLETTEDIPIQIEEIKLSLLFKIQLQLFPDITPLQFDLLRFYLKNPEHNIFHLNLSEVKNEYILKLIALLNEPNVSFRNTKIINFGYRNMDQQDFILFSKWLLNLFSLYQDNDDLKLKSFL